ncbi:hypothetical protein ACIQI7_12630 [Kitasatospora sp. NPDC092039]|uniref:hypothetical protein n=1 Tax=Kitasatospora sp. NPDC092039 TaxID=3364086 RepID=UPI003816A62A
MGGQLPDDGLGLVAVGVAGVEVAVLPDLVHVRCEVAVVENHVEPAVAAAAGDAPAVGARRGPREVDVRAGAGQVGALAFGLLVGCAPALGRRLGLVVPIGLLAQSQERGPALGGLALQLQGGGAARW